MKHLKNLNWLDKLAGLILIIGGLNWGLVALFNYDLVAVIFGAGSVLARIVYLFVAIAAVYVFVVATHLRDHK